MKQNKLSKVFIWGFLFLYLLVACISFCHAVEFFSIGNPHWMSVTLAFAFELGLALSLAAILLSDNRKNTLPWILMGALCIVQVIGNVFSTYKFIVLADNDYYQFLSKPLLFFIEEVPEETVQIIISWIIGAILPIIALFMTDMVATNIKSLDATKEGGDMVEEASENKEEVIAATPAPVKEEKKAEPKAKPYQENSIINEQIIQAKEKKEDPVFNLPPHLRDKMKAKLNAVNKS